MIGGKKEESVRESTRLRSIGCCNVCSDFQEVSVIPHEVGSYVVNWLRSWDSDRRLICLKSTSGINNSLRELCSNDSDVFFLDEIDLDIGKFKILKLLDYGGRGHNAVKFYLTRIGKGKKKNPWLILIGVRSSSLSFRSAYVNAPLTNGNEALKLKLGCLFIARSFLGYWPNRSLVIQSSTELFNLWDCNSREPAREKKR